MADVVLAVNMTIMTKKVLTHVQLQRMTYNENGNLSGLLGTTATSGMLLPTMTDVILSAARRINPNIIDATSNQKGH